MVKLGLTHLCSLAALDDLLGLNHSIGHRPPRFRKACSVATVSARTCALSRLRNKSVLGCWGMIMLVKALCLKMFMGIMLGIRIKKLIRMTRQEGNNKIVLDMESMKFILELSILIRCLLNTINMKYLI